MLVCHCRQVNDRAITDTVQAGAQSPREVAEKCGAGTRCGGCWPAIQQLVAQINDTRFGARHLEPVLSAP